MAPRFLLFAAAVLLPLSTPAAAQPTEAGRADAAPAVVDANTAPASDSSRELWVTTGFLSHHTGQSTRYRYNEHNDGIGLEWHWAPQWQLNAGHYRNSVRRNSSYLQAAWMPWAHEWPDAGWRMQAGASLGVVNGYPKVEHSRYFGTLVPALALEGRRFGANLVYIPSVGKKVDGAFALQLKLRVD
jgi:hypothetical protein